MNTKTLGLIATAGLLCGAFACLVSPIFADRGAIELRTIPPRATAHIDGKALSLTTPFKVEVPVGAHEVTLSLPGHKTKTLRLNLRPGTNGLKVVRLEAAGTQVATVWPDAQTWR